MDEAVRKELDTLKGMVLNWKKGFLGWASPGGDNEYVLQEFSEEIQNQLYPYVRRMFETKNLTESEAREFMDYCHGEVADLRRHIEELEARGT